MADHTLPRPAGRRYWLALPLLALFLALGIYGYAGQRAPVTVVNDREQPLFSRQLSGLDLVHRTVNHQLENREGSLVIEVPSVPRLPPTAPPPETGSPQNAVATDRPEVTAPPASVSPTPFIPDRDPQDCPT